MSKGGRDYAASTGAASIADAPRSHRGREVRGARSWIFGGAEHRARWRAGNGARQQPGAGPRPNGGAGSTRWVDRAALHSQLAAAVQVVVYAVGDRADAAFPRLRYCARTAAEWCVSRRSGMPSRACSRASKLCSGSSPSGVADDDHGSCRSPVGGCRALAPASPVVDYRRRNHVCGSGAPVGRQRRGRCGGGLAVTGLASSGRPSPVGQQR